MVREDVAVDAEGAILHAWWYPARGRQAGTASPCVVMAHGWTSTKKIHLDKFAEVFAAAGLCVLVFDHRGWGDSGTAPGKPRHEVDPWEQIRDYQHAITFAQNRSGVDPDRIGVWGVSLGGYYAPRFASGDERIKACVSLCGPYTFGENWDIMPTLTRETFEVRSRSKDEDDARALALTLTMDGRTASLRCPTLVVAGKKDRLIPWQQAERLHREVEGSDFLLLEDGNHGCANVLSAHRYRTADWMAARLAA